MPFSSVVWVFPVSPALRCEVSCLPHHHKHTLFHFDTIFFFTSCYVKHWVFRLVTLTYEPSALFQFHYLECESQWVMPDSRLLLLWCCSHFNSIDSRIGVVRKRTKEGREKQMKDGGKRKRPRLTALVHVCTHKRTCRWTPAGMRCVTAWRGSVLIHSLCAPRVEKGHCMYVCMWEVCM